MSRLRSFLSGSLLIAGTALWSPSANALPGVFVGKGKERRLAPTTHVVVANKGDFSVVTILPEYAGPLTPFTLVLPLPSDVTIERIKSMKREFIDRIENITAPRFHEWWEKDPCDPGAPQQEWERDLRVSGGGFLNPNAMPAAPKKRVPPEMLLRVEPIFMEKESEYTCSLLAAEEAQNVEGFLKGKGYQVSQQVKSGLDRYVSQGMNLLACDVDTSKVALVAGSRAQLAGIRYWTERPVRKLPVTLGLANLDDKQDLFVYVMDPEHRFEVKNYPNLFPPTNIEVEYVVKERPSEFYNAIHDKLLAMHPNAWLNEYFWPTDGCGHPCPNEPLYIHEVLSLGGDILDEKTVTDEERFPAPPDETEQEKEAFAAELKELKPKERKEAKKEREEERKELARRKALLKRQQYLISRLHYRYDAKTLAKDPEIGPAAKHVKGGIGIPKGMPAKLPQGHRDDDKNSQFQVRFTHFHKWKTAIKGCEKPERGRWGKRWREIRLWNHVWVADALSRKRRTEIKPEEVTRTPIPELGLSGVPVKAISPDAGVDAGTTAGKNGKGCGCTLPAQRSLGTGWLVLAAGLLPMARRRGRRRH
ncbi:DUF2330 domain-containing protein [Myxococcota bacterium]